MKSLFGAADANLPICGKQAKVWQPGGYKICFCPGDCGDFEISAAAESAMSSRGFDGKALVVQCESGETLGGTPGV
jgi:hypothetical protein